MFAPFLGWFFSTDRVPHPEAVTTPPYDQMGEDDRRRYLHESPYNVVRLLQAPGGPQRYQRAGRTLAEWVDSAVLAPDEQPAFYEYEISYPVRGGMRTTRGLVGALDLIELGERVLPHEETIAGVSADLLQLLRSARANLDPIMVLSTARGLETLLHAEGEPRLDFRVGTERHRLWPITDPDRCRTISTVVSGAPLAIADGHHRYTTALRYRLEREEQDGAGPWSSIMSFITSPAGLEIGPIHRLFARATPSDVDDLFHVEEADPRPPERPGDLVTVTRSGARRLVPRQEAVADLPSPWRKSSAAVAREVLYPRLGVDEGDAAYHPDLRRILEELSTSPDGMAILTAPVPPAAIIAATRHGVRFPQKTTFFTPKPRAGLVLRLFDR